MRLRLPPRAAFGRPGPDTRVRAGRAARSMRRVSRLALYAAMHMLPQIGAGAGPRGGRAGATLCYGGFNGPASAKMHVASPSATRILSGLGVPPNAGRGAAQAPKTAARRRHQKDRDRVRRRRPGIAASGGSAARPLPRRRDRTGGAPYGSKACRYDAAGLARSHMMLALPIQPKKPAAPPPQS